LLHLRHHHRQPDLDEKFHHQYLELELQKVYYLFHLHGTENFLLLLHLIHQVLLVGLHFLLHPFHHLQKI
jgi:hypothetical protein